MKPTTIAALAALVDVDTRCDAAMELARRVGAERLVVLVRDHELGVLLPAPGFPSTIHGGSEWRSLLDACTGPGIQRAEVNGEAVLALVDAGGAAVVLFGGAPDPGALEEVVSGLPLLSGMLRAESASLVSAGEAAVAREIGQRAHDLALALDAARAELEQTLGESARLNQQLQQADERKDEFLAMLGHELRNPMAAISSALELMRISDGNLMTAHRARSVIERQAEQLARLIDDLLDVARITRGKIVLRPERVDLNQIALRAADTARGLIESKRHALAVHHGAPLWAMADRTRLEQMITNLLTNAAKYTDPGGRIALTIDRDGEEAVVRVADSGIGIAPEALAQVFEPFVQVAPSLDRSGGGIGIGLTLVSRLAALHGGRAEAKSELGEGSEFSLRLPALPSGAAAIAPPSPPSPSPARSKRVLIVDDNLDSAEMVAELVAAWGHHTQQAHDGLIAVDVAVEFCPDVVLLDLGLPGLDGYEVARKLREMPTTSGARLVAVSGYGLDKDRAKSRDAGFDTHLVKPVDFAALRRELGD